MEYTDPNLRLLPNASMTPEELNRTIEFIFQSQSRVAAAQEQDRKDRIRCEEESEALDRLLAKLEMQTHLLEKQTHRLEGQSNLFDDDE